MTLTEKRFEITETDISKLSINEDKTDSYKYVIKRSYGPDIFVDENRNIRLNDKVIGYKLKMIIGDEYYTHIVTQDNYLFDVPENKLVSSSKIKDISLYEDNDVGVMRYKVVFENGFDYEITLD